VSSRLVVLTVTLLAVPSSPFLASAEAAGVPFQTGDVLAGVGNGMIRHFRPDGTLVDTLVTGRHTYNTGMAFNAAGDLYATGFDAQTVFVLDHNGNLTGSFGSGYDRNPESIVFDRDGNAYVGQPDGSRQILKFSPAGVLLDAYRPQVEARGTDWVDLAPDQCTLHYTSEGSSLKAFDVCTRTQLPDFATGLAGPCFAHRIRPNGEVLLACATQVYRFSQDGRVIQTYPLPGRLFALNLDPDNKTFWTGGYSTGTVFRINIASGDIVTQFDSAPSTVLAGLTVVGELTPIITVPPSTKSYYVRPNVPLLQRQGRTLPELLRDAGRDLAQQQTARGIAQDSVVALLFGAQTTVNGEPGATLWGEPHTLGDIAALVESFAIGYYNCFGTADCPGTSQANQNMHVRIVIATNNSGRNVTSAQGERWAGMVNEVGAWVIDQGYAGRVDVAGGNDMEPDFNDAPATRAWVDGYASVLPPRFLYNVGAASGCPTNPATQTAAAGLCGTPAHPNWTQEDVWYLSWGADPAQAIPEIYTPAQPSQWTLLSLYGYLNPQRRNGGSVIMSGALTELGACTQGNNNDPTCQPQPYRPAEGWQAFFNALNGDLRTAQTLPWSTDIRWLGHEGDITLVP
jgi:hypothetical protein